MFILKIKNKIKNKIKFSLIYSLFSIFFILSLNNVNALEYSINDLSSDNKIQTSINISKYAYPNGSNNIIISNTNQVSDALSVSPYARVIDAPVLLSDRNALSSNTLSEIERLHPKNIVIIGGENSISNNIQAQLEKSFSVKRISGKNRVETSISIYKNLKSKLHKDYFEDIFAVDGRDGISDAATIGSVASKDNSPIIILPNNKMSSSKIIKSLKYNKINFIGGKISKINEEVDKSIKIYGKNREETNLKIANIFFDDDKYKNNRVDTAFLVNSGKNNENELIDSVLVGGIAGKLNSPILFISKNISYTDELKEYINKSNIKNFIVVSNDIKNQVNKLFYEKDSNSKINEINTNKNRSVNSNNDLNVKKNININTNSNTNKDIIKNKRDYVLLGVPHLNQLDANAPMGCEATSLLQGLRYKGYAKNLTLNQFLRQMPIARDNNPNHGFASTPFKIVRGVYQSILPEPLSRWGMKYGTVLDISGKSPDYIREEIKNGNPVVFFGTLHFKPPIFRDYFWGTNAIDNAHVMLADGFDKNRMHIVDPISYKSGYWIDKNLFDKIYNYKKYAVVIK